MSTKQDKSTRVLRHPYMDHMLQVHREHKNQAALRLRAEEAKMREENRLAERGPFEKEDVGGEEAGQTRAGS
jgi:hypothetical protein